MEIRKRIQITQIMNTCKSCKYWGNGWPIKENTANECGCISMAESNSKAQAFIDVQVNDDSGLDAKLMTVSSFGCTLHSIK